MKKLIRVTTVPLSLEKLLGNQLTYMNSFYDVTAVSSDEEELARVATQLGVKHHCVEMTRKITPLKDLKAIWDMYRFLKKEKPDIIHSHTPKAGMIAMMAGYMAGVPVRMHTVAGLPLLETSGIKSWVLETVEKLIYRCSTQVYPNSKGLKEIMIQRGLGKPGKLTVLGNGSSNGIDTNYFDPTLITTETRESLRKKLEIAPQDYVFVFVGRLVKDKGINELVAAFARLQKNRQHLSAGNTEGESFHRSDLKLLLVGPSEQDLDPLAPLTLSEIDRNSHIITVGYQQDVRPYLAVSDCLVFPSYREGFPNAVMQAGAMGLPAIVTNINGCNEIVTHLLNGIIIPVKESVALENAMRLISEDTELHHRMKDLSRRIICENFGQTRIWTALKAEYERLSPKN